MNKKFLISWVVVFVVWMVASVLLHGVWLGSDYAQLTHMMRPEAEQQSMMHLMVLAHLMLAGGFVWIYQRGNEDKPWLPQGVRFGIAVAILAPIPTYLVYYIVQQTPGMLAVKQAIGDTVIVILLGMIVAFLNRPESAAAATESVDA